LEVTIFDRLLQKKCRGSFAEGPRHPGNPARLRSERARNSLKNISYHKAVQMLQIQPEEFLPPQQTGRL